MAFQNQIITKIHSGQFSEKELINLYNNATRLHSTDTINAIRQHMRGSFPRAANKIFGAKEKVACGVLEDTFLQLAKEFDFGGNKHLSKVKPGGDRVTGNMYVDVYISFKNKDGYATVLGLRQKDPYSELSARVEYYKTGNQSFCEEYEYAMCDYNQAVDLYKQYLLKVMV